MKFGDIIYDPADADREFPHIFIGTLSSCVHDAGTTDKTYDCCVVAALLIKDDKHPEDFIGHYDEDWTLWVDRH